MSGYFVLERGDCREITAGHSVAQARIGAAL